MFDISPKWGRIKVWLYVDKIRALKAKKIIWPEDNFGDDMWIMTVDGTHCWIEEPQHPEWSQDREYYSHKYNKAGINYELGISISTQQLIWMNGPFKAGMNDKFVFTEKGLESKLLEIGKKAIGDGGYGGHQEAISAPNRTDSYSVRKFKSRALLRHETFNGRTKRFHSINSRFRHGPQQFAKCFEAICVICQYMIENNEPLFDVLIEDILEENENSEDESEFDCSDASSGDDGKSTSSAGESN